MNDAICCFFGLRHTSNKTPLAHGGGKKDIQGGMAAYLSRGVEAAGARGSLGGDAWMTADSGSASAAAAAGSGGVGVKVDTASCWSAILVLSTIRGVPFIREIDGRTAPGCSAGTDIDIHPRCMRPAAPPHAAAGPSCAAAVDSGSRGTSTRRRAPR